MWAEPLDAHVRKVPIFLGRWLTAYESSAWIFVAVLAVPNAWIVFAAFRRARQEAGHCQACGYDLRATPERCPECGRVAVTHA